MPKNPYDMRIGVGGVRLMCRIAGAALVLGGAPAVTTATIVMLLAADTRHWSPIDGQFRYDFATGPSYVYAVGGQPLIGTAIRFTPGACNGIAPAPDDDAPGLGVVTVFHHPADPRRTVLRRGVGLPHVLAVLMPIALVGVGSVMWRAGVDGPLADV